MIDQALESIKNLDPQFQARVNALLQAAAGRVRVISGHRTPEQQQALWETAAKLYGPAAADKWVAQPGHSNHEKGVAVDFQGDLALAHRLAPQFGLVAPMSWEDWHFEPSGVQTNAKAYTVAPPGFPDPTAEQNQTSTAHHLAALAGALAAVPMSEAAVRTARANGADVTTASTILPSTTAEHQVAVTAPVTAPPPAAPPGQSTASVIASPTVGNDTEKLLAGQPLTDTGSGGATTDQVNGAAGAAGVVGNPSGTGHIQSTPERENFATALLTKMGLPVTPENLRALVAWQQGEGTSAAFNPLATTDHAPGSTAFNDNNGTPVQNFVSFEQGVDTTIRTLTNGRYGNILAALQAGNSAVAVAEAIKASPWGTGALVLKILTGSG